MNKKIYFLNMNTRFAHSSLAIPYILSYIKENGYSGKYVFKDSFIQTNPEEIAYDILKFSPDILALSVYLWNIEYYKKIIEIIKTFSKKICIIAGGPEVSYENKKYKSYFDYIISGEGEIPFLNFINGNHNYVTRPGIDSKLDFFEVDNLNKIPSPFLNGIYDISNKDFVFYESSRGCHGKCDYCMSSLTKNVRYFSIDRVFEEISYIINSPVKSVRFIDRTFNSNISRCCKIIEYILKNNTNKHFQFEMRPELISDELIDILKTSKSGELQFELGIQSVNEDVLRNINRPSNVGKQVERLKKLSNSTSVHMHCDLISGLPDESIEDFLEAIDKVYEMGADTIQIGRLKLLSGTEIKKKYSKGSYSNFPPYPVLCSNKMSFNDIFCIDRVARLVQIYFNDGKFFNSIKYLIEVFGKFSKLFISLYEFWNNSNWHNIGLKKTFVQLNDFILQSQSFSDIEKETALELLKVDYHLCFRDEFLSTKKIKKNNVVKNKKLNEINPNTILKLNSNIKHFLVNSKTSEILGIDNNCFIFYSKNKNIKNTIIVFQSRLESKVFQCLTKKANNAKKISEELEVNFEKVYEIVIKYKKMGYIL